MEAISLHQEPGAQTGVLFHFLFREEKVRSLTQEERTTQKKLNKDLEAPGTFSKGKTMAVHFTAIASTCTPHNKAVLLNSLV